MIFECSRAVSNESIASTVASRSSTTFGRPNSITEVTTEVGVDGDLLGEEVAGDVGIRAGKLLCGNTPRLRVGMTRGDVGWDIVGTEMPDLNYIISPFHGNDSSTNAVETFTVLRSDIVEDGAACSIGAGVNIVLAVGSLNGT